MKRTAALAFAAVTVAGVVAAPAAVPASAPARIAFTLRFSKGQLYSVHSDGSHQQRLTTSLEESFQPVESPDGRHILFARGSDEAATDIYVMDRDGSNVRNLTHRKGADYDPMWSPDGKRIAFTSGRSGDDETYVMETDGSHVHRTRTPAETTRTPRGPRTESASSSPADGPASATRSM